jgi:hypothetical protein
MAAFSVELVEVPELLELCPRSSLIDSLVLVPRLDRSELIEVVLIPLLPLTLTARGGSAVVSKVIGRSPNFLEAGGL